MPIHTPYQRTAGTLIALSFLTSGVLVAPELPLVGAKLALPDIFIASLIIIQLPNIARAHAYPQDLPPVISAALHTSLAFIYTSWVSFAIGALRNTGPLSHSLIDTLNYTYGHLMMAALATSTRAWRSHLSAWNGGAAIVASVAIAALFGAAPDWAYDGYRVSSTLRAVNQMQSYLGPPLAIAFIFTICLTKSLATRILSLALMTAVAVTLASSGSRSSVLVFSTAVPLSVLLLLRHNLVRPAMLMAISILIILITIIATWFSHVVWTSGVESLPDYLRPFARPIERIRLMIYADSTISALGPRGEQLQIAWQHWHETPLFGIGPGQFMHRFQHRNEIHNTYVGLIMEHGLVGLGLFLALIFQLLNLCRVLMQRSKAYYDRVHSTALSSAVIVLLVYGMTVFGLRQRVLWLAFGLVLIAYQQTYTHTGCLSMPSQTSSRMRNNNDRRQ